MTPLKDLAINCALLNKWEEAYQINKQILEENPNDIDTLNRLGFTLIRLGKYKESKETYKNVLLIDPTNPIALKNVKKLENISKGNLDDKCRNSSFNPLINDLFIEEAGKTKTIELKNIADKNTLSILEPGDCIELTVKRSKIFAQTKEKKYIGMLPEHVGIRLITFMKGGNQYQTFVKAVDDKNVTVFIKETKRAGRFKNQPSFTLTNFYQQLEGISPEE